MEIILRFCTDAVSLPAVIHDLPGDDRVGKSPVNPGPVRRTFKKILRAAVDANHKGAI
jgi:hypothetical protein